MKSIELGIPSETTEVHIGVKWKVLMSKMSTGVFLMKMSYSSFLRSLKITSKHSSSKLNSSSSEIGSTSLPFDGMCSVLWELTGSLKITSKHSSSKLNSSFSEIDLPSLPFDGMRTALRAVLRAVLATVLETDFILIFLYFLLHAVTDFLNKMESNFQILVSFPSVSILFIRRFVSSSDHSENFTILNRLYLR